MTDTLWSPTADRIDRSALREYLNWLEVREGRPFPDHDALWAWSVEDLDRFWSSIVDYYESSSRRRGRPCAPPIRCRTPAGSAAPG
jgi:hypothetical protein